MAIGPEDIGIADLGIALADLAGSWLLRGLLAAWLGSIGWLLVGKDGKGGLAGILRFGIPTGFHTFHIDLGGPIRSLNSAVVSTISEAALGLDHQSGRFFHGAAELTVATAREIQNVTNDVVTWGKWVVHIFVPTHTHAVTHRWIDLTQSNTKAIARINVQAQTLAKGAPLAAAHTATGAATVGASATIPRPTRKQKAAAAAAAAAAGGLALPGGLTGIEHTLGDVWGYTKRHIRLHHLRLSRLEKLLGAAGMALAMANALGLPNWRCITRGNLGRVSRAICGLGTAALQDLLGLIADVLILEYICDVITLMEDGLSLIEGPLNDWIGTADAIFAHCNYDLPAPLALRVSLGVPPVTGLALTVP